MGPWPEARRAARHHPPTPARSASPRRAGSARGRRGPTASTSLPKRARGGQSSAATALVPSKRVLNASSSRRLEQQEHLAPLRRAASDDGVQASGAIASHMIAGRLAVVVRPRRCARWSARRRLAGSVADVLARDDELPLEALQARRPTGRAPRRAATPRARRTPNSATAAASEADRVGAGRCACRLRRPPRPTSVGRDAHARARPGRSTPGSQKRRNHQPSKGT